MGVLVLVAAMPGCRGCGKGKTPEEISEEEEKRRKEEEEKKQKPFEVSELATRPHEINPDRARYKPGHWTSATLRAKANQFTMHGDLVTEILDRQRRRIDLEGTRYNLTASRQIALQEKQEKVVETQLFVPQIDGQPQVSLRIEGRRPSSVLYESGGQFLWPLKPYQYFFVVLATAPGDYLYVRTLDSVKYPMDLGYDFSSLGYYPVRLVDANRQTGLPSHGLYWTSIAYVLLGDFEPEMLRRAQQQAMLDWIHWGGQLIVSGPEALEPLRHTLLAEYLPANRKDTRELTVEDLNELNGVWSRSRLDSRDRPLAPVERWAGIALEKHPQGRDVPGTGGLLVERRVGRGRIVVSAFRLNQRELVSWPCLDEFFNACLLGRPPRRFAENQGVVQVAWADQRHPFDPRRLTQVRYFTRDSGRPFDEYTMFEPSDEDYSGTYGTAFQSSEGADTGLASWSDNGKVAGAARSTLSGAAAIEIPDRRFVAWLIGGYLLVLVPLNWSVCRLIGRVELAWVAAPIVAVVWTALVIHLARLDIGFARSQTEISVVELQGQYPRAHVTRYLALYTSLSTSYRLESENPGTLMLPFPGEDPEDARFGRRPLHFRYGKDSHLRGLSVRSNTTGMAHTEQMLDLGGPIRLKQGTGGPPQVVNETGLTLHDACVVRYNRDRQRQLAWIGTLEPGGAAPLAYVVVKDETSRASRGSRSASSERLPEELNLNELIAQAESADELGAGEQRLVAWSADPIPGLTVKPLAPQIHNVALVVAHLAYGFGPGPQPDRVPRWKVDRDARRVLTPE
jgi:hypothetical protein